MRVSFLLLAIVSMALSTMQCRAEDATAPLHKTVDIKIGETVSVELTDKSIARVRVIDLQETRDSVRNAIRRANVRLEINGVEGTLISGNYQLPKVINGVQIDCPATRGLNESASGRDDPWGLRADVRLRLWPAGSNWIAPDQFVYPLKQRWFASATQMSNEPSYVDGGDAPLNRTIYYHYGLDIGGAEGLTEVLAATDGIVVSAAMEIEPGSTSPPVAARGDVIYIRDARNWYYRYSHLQRIDVRLGERVSKGQTIGLLGKEGATAWSHLHFDIKAVQPSGKWGIEDGYAFLWQAYRQQYKPKIQAVARPHQLIYAGQTVELDASLSWCEAGSIRRYEWTFSDGTTSAQVQVQRKYPEPGQYCETLKVVDSAGRTSFDFATVLVIDRKLGQQDSPTLHASYWPTQRLRPQDPVIFKVRAFACQPLGETWDFGDGTPPVTVRSDGNAERHAKNGYAEVEHRFDKPGDYLVSVRHPGRDGHPMTARLHVHIESSDVDQ